jgi:hypothetical protein
MYGWQARPCMDVWVCIDGSTWFLKVVKCFSRPSLWFFAELFVVIFLAEF